MQQAHIDARKRELSKQQAIYCANRVRGLSRQQSAIAAGYADWENVGAKVEESLAVQEELARARAEVAKTAGVTKEDFVEGLKQAADMAKTMADPQAMVRAWSELGKALGFYAPEVKRLEKGINKADLKRALEDLSDEELDKISRGRVIEGKFTREEEPPKLLEVQKG